jgi:hypothetical protein
MPRNKTYLVIGGHILHTSRVSNPEDISSSHAVEAVSSDFEENSKRPSRRKIIIGILVTGLTVLIVGGAVALTQLSGGGIQPEELLPADTVAFAKVDLNPSLGQKIEFVRFISHFSGTLKNFDSKDPVGSVVNQFNQTSSLNWDEIKPWIGNRFAIAGVQGADGVAPVLVLGVSDEAQMKYYFAKHRPDFKYVVNQGFAIIADSQDTLNIISASPTHLTSNATFEADIVALGGSQVAVLWGDVKPLLKSAGSGIDSLASDQGLGSLSNIVRSANGRVVIGLHFTSNSLAATFLTRGSETSEENFFSSSQADLGNLPEEILAGVSISGFGDSLFKAINSNADLSNALDSAGLSSLQFKAIFNGPLSLLVLPAAVKDETPLFAVKLTPSDISLASKSLQAVINPNSSLGILASQIEVKGKDIYLGTDAAALKRVISVLSTSKNKLKDSKSYSKAFPEPGSLMAYANLQKLLPLLQVSGEALKFGSVSLATSGDKSQSGNTKTLLTLSLKE